MQGLASQVRTGEPPDRTRVARVGLGMVGVSLFLWNFSPITFAPLLLAFFLPRFRVLGWWLSVVVVAFLTSILFGLLLSVARNWDQAVFEAPGLLARYLIVVGVAQLGCFVALFGLLSKGTRNAVERRTLEIAPHAFDDEPPSTKDTPGSP